jgi:hypothetical protein
LVEYVISPVREKSLTSGTSGMVVRKNESSRAV